jgi:hypothetical protein
MSDVQVCPPSEVTFTKTGPAAQTIAMKIDRVQKSRHSPTNESESLVRHGNFLSEKVCGSASRSLLGSTQKSSSLGPRPSELRSFPPFRKSSKLVLVLPLDAFCSNDPSSLASSCGQLEVNVTERQRPDQAAFRRNNQGRPMLQRSFVQSSGPRYVTGGYQTLSNLVVSRNLSASLRHD